MKTKVAIQGAEFFAYHGFYDEEQKAGNWFIVGLEVELAEKDMSTDDISLTVNYEQLYQICQSEMRQTQRLIETVAHRILQTVRQTFSDITGARVIIEKIAPQLGGKVAKSVIEMQL